MNELDAVEVRVLGSLIEKEATTPEYYPLTLNALVNACNQKSNRDPVVSYDTDSLEDALESLRAKHLVLIVSGSGRVQKYAQRLSETANLGRRELAVLCVLFLRGMQTLGEIKDRSDKIFHFGDLGETERVLDKLAEWPGGPFVKKLPRQAGQKESRYAHLLSGEPQWESLPEPFVSAGGAPTRVAQLEQELQQLRTEVEELRTRFNALEAQLR